MRRILIDSKNRTITEYESKDKIEDDKYFKEFLGDRDVGLIIDEAVFFISPSKQKNKNKEHLFKIGNRIFAGNCVITGWPSITFFRNAPLSLESVRENVEFLTKNNLSNDERTPDIE